MISMDRFDNSSIPDIQDNDYGYCLNCGEGISEYSQSITGCCEECLEDDDMRDDYEEFEEDEQ